METSYVNLFGKQELLISVIAHELVTESYDELEQALIKLGAEISPANFSVKKAHYKRSLSQFLEEHLESYKKAIIVPGLDSFPLYILIEKVETIILSKTCTSIVWSGGGSSSVDEKYYYLLQKVWVKARRLVMQFDLFESKQEADINAELHAIENYDVLAKKCLDIRTSKNQFVKDLQFSSAGEVRMEEKEVLKELHLLADGVFYRHCENAVLKLLNEEVDPVT